MEEKIRKILEEKVDPVLQEHFGGAVLSRFEDGIAYIKMTGACAQCPSAQETLESIVRDFIIGGCPEVEDVVLDTTVSDDLLDMARKILNGEFKED